MQNTSQTPSTMSPPTMIVEPLVPEKREPYTAQLNPAMCTEAMKTLIGLVVKLEETTESAVIRHAVSLFLKGYFINSDKISETGVTETE